MQAKWPIAAMFVLLGIGPGQSETLTCAAFKDRLNGAILAATVQNAQAVVFRTGFTDASRRTRYDWGDEALGGALRCGAADEFEEFGISMRFRAKDTFANDIDRLLTMQGASICALASESALACKDYGRTMLENALAQMGRNAARGARTPNGLVDRTLFAGVPVELTAAPTLVTFVVGPGRGETLEASRQNLLPPDAKPSP